MEIALLLYDGLAPLDAIGPYEVMRNVPDWTVRTVAKQQGEVRDERGTLGLVADREAHLAHRLAEYRRRGPDGQLAVLEEVNKAGVTAAGLRRQVDHSLQHGL